MNDSKTKASMTLDTSAPSVVPPTALLGLLVMTLAEDAVFGLATGGGVGLLEGLGERRSEAYAVVLSGHRVNTMAGQFDSWALEMTRAMAPLRAPAWMPMGEVIREGVTLEVGARGLRSLFSSKPSDKEVQRVKRIGTLAVRVLRAVLNADGPLEPDEAHMVASLIVSLGLPDEVAGPLRVESPVPIDQLDVYGDIAPAVVKALLRGAWFAAAADQMDPREEDAIRVLASNLAFPVPDLEVMRKEVVQSVEQRRILGLAVVDAVRFVLSDRMRGHGATLAAKAGALVLPRRYREEALAPLTHDSPATLGKRYTQLGADDRQTVLGIAWAAALYEDPSVARRALLRARHDRVADDLGDRGKKVRHGVEDWINDMLARDASSIGAE
jgi:hypothetical protein